MSCAVFATRSMLYYRHAYYSDKLRYIMHFYLKYRSWPKSIPFLSFFTLIFKNYLYQIYLRCAIIIPENNHTPTMGVLIWTSTHLEFSDCFFREFIWEILSALPFPLSEISKTIPSLEDVVVLCNKKIIEYLLHIKYWHLPKYVYLNFFLLCDAVYFKH